MYVFVSCPPTPPACFFFSSLPTPPPLIVSGESSRLRRCDSRATSVSVLAPFIIRQADESFVLQEKRYRSMQEHIRRAHPEHYISKLPATEESFLLMINTPPSERPPPQPSSSTNSTSNHHQSPKPYAPDRSFYRDDYSSPGTPRHYDDYHGALLPAATNAAAALAALHKHRANSDWEAEGVSTFTNFESLSRFEQHILTLSCRTPFRTLSATDYRDHQSSFPQSRLTVPT